MAGLPGEDYPAFYFGSFFKPGKKDDLPYDN
jgi:hypothetical protein